MVNHPDHHIFLREFVGIFIAGLSPLMQTMSFYLLSKGMPIGIYVHFALDHPYFACVKR